MCKPAEGQIAPLADVTPIWEHDYSVYPDMLRVAMEDGKVVNYRIDIVMPHPAFSRVMKLMEKIPYGVSQYGYKARHGKK